MLSKLKRIIFRSFFRGMENFEVTMEELKKMQVKDNAIILDVRSEQEYNEGHIDEAINIPEYKISKQTIKNLKEKERYIIVYCEAGSRSKDAYKKLVDLGYKNVYSLYGGLENWEI